MRRVLATLAATALALSAGSSILAAEPVSAASKPIVTACFRYSDGGPWTDWVNFSQRDGSGRWHTLGRARADLRSGCASFYSNPNRTVGMYVHERVGRALFHATTGPHYVQTTDVNLGTYTVYQKGSN